MSTFHCAQTVLSDHDYAIARALQLRTPPNPQRQAALNNLDREAHLHASTYKHAERPAERWVKKPVASNRIPPEK